MYQVDDRISPDNELVQVFWGQKNTSNNTSIYKWTKPKNISFVYFFLMAGGSGGAAGTIASGLSEGLANSFGNSLSGGYGGRSGGIYQSFYPAYLVPDILYVFPGSGGSGGQAKTWGQPASSVFLGSAGKNSEINYIPYCDISVQSIAQRSVFMQAEGGAVENLINRSTPSKIGFNNFDILGTGLGRWGDFGTSQSITPSSSPNDVSWYFRGGISSSSHEFFTSSTGGVPFYFDSNAMNTGGAGGGSVSYDLKTACSGGSVNILGIFSSIVNTTNSKLLGGASGFLSDGGRGQNGLGYELIGTDLSKLLTSYPLCFTGGAGGGASVSGSGGDGGNGGPGCGGGGGGASWGPVGSKSGKGGDGGPGFIAIICV